MDMGRVMNQELSRTGGPAYQWSQVLRGATKYSVMKPPNADNNKSPNCNLPRLGALIMGLARDHIKGQETKVEC